MTLKNIILLGATGSIGTSTLNLIRKKREKFNLIGVCEKIRWFCKNQLNWSKNTPTDNITWILANEPRLTLCVLLGRSSFESSFEKNRN